MTVIKVYIDAAHSRFSPGCVYGKRQEWLDNLRLAGELCRAMNAAGRIEAVTNGGEGGSPSERLREAALSGCGRVLVLHRACSPDLAVGSGCRAFLPDFAGCRIFEEAYELLLTVSAAGNFKYRGVHPYTEKNPHKSLADAPLEGVILLETGFIDNGEDNRKFDRCCRELAAAVAESAAKLWKGSD